MKTIRILFVDFWEGFVPEKTTLWSILSSNYNAIISEDPEYLIYSLFGYRHLSYNCIKIFYSGEQSFPNMDLCDYAIGHEYLSFGDRFFRWPYYLLYSDSLKAIDFDYMSKGLNQETTNRNFCSFVYSNNNDTSGREDFFLRLNQYKKIDSGGLVLNNIGYQVLNKNKFLSNYKFTIAFENSISEGYTTEKIFDAFNSKTVPIYFGNPLINLEFNNDSFINCHEFNNFDEVIQHIIELDNDDESYLKMLFSEKRNFGFPKLIEFEAFLFNIFNQDITQARRKSNSQRAEMKFNDEKSLRLKYNFVNIMKKIVGTKVVKFIKFVIKKR
jgi:hypothetical protein